MNKNLPYLKSIVLLVLFFPFFNLRGQMFEELPKLKNNNESIFYITPVVGTGVGGYVYKTGSLEGFEQGTIIDEVLTYDFDLVFKADVGLLFMVDTRLLPRGKRLLFGYGIENEWYSAPAYLDIIGKEVHISSELTRHFLRGELFLSESRSGYGFFVEGGVFNIKNNFERDYNDRFSIAAGLMISLRTSDFMNLFLQSKIDYTHYKSSIPLVVEPDSEEIIIESTNNNIGIEIGLGLRFGMLKKPRK
ncbi:hypothetical protein UJ101_00274 [Flavobacteriaceae bacterium UJ101]|nr:hypothetical protein UJ101_00274 [Flavobacteriaceae bacterium UJ101]